MSNYAWLQEFNLLNPGKYLVYCVIVNTLKALKTINHKVLKNSSSLEASA